jgi:hypothetical protein
MASMGAKRPGGRKEGNIVLFYIIVLYLDVYV